MGCMYTVYRMTYNKLDQWLLAGCGNHTHNSLCSLSVSLSFFSHRHLGLSLMLPLSMSVVKQAQQASSDAQ